MGVYLGIGLASLINVLNPEIVVIGGGLSNGWDLFEKHMHQQVIERAFPHPGAARQDCARRMWRRCGLAWRRAAGVCGLNLRNVNYG